ncbi:MAG: SCO family protein [Desulfurivibrio sp.]|jgi:protein SCO1/2|nr:MAG: SCO family protein [Desulfurivibrio sp.]
MGLRIILTIRIFTILLVIFCLTGAEAGAVKYERSVESVTIPDVVLVNQQGDKVRLKSLLETDQPVLVDFIYATCTTICPILSAGFANLQRELGPEAAKVRLVSFTIDPENDTPGIMQEYLDRYQAQPGWDFLTGSRQDIDRVMKAFNAYFRSKMDHQPLSFIRSQEDGKWIRLYGLMSSSDLMKEFQQTGGK